MEPNKKIVVVDEDRTLRRFLSQRINGEEVEYLSFAKAIDPFVRNEIEKQPRFILTNGLPDHQRLILEKGTNDVPLMTFGNSFKTICHFSLDHVQYVDQWASTFLKLSGRGVGQ
jgi:hypothetical protein